MSKWQVYDERGGSFVGYVEAPDHDHAIATAIGKFDHVLPSLAYVRRIEDVPRDIPLDLTKLRRLPEALPPKKNHEAEETHGPALIPNGEEDWRDGPRDDGSVDSDEILPDH